MGCDLRRTAVRDPWSAGHRGHPPTSPNDCKDLIPSFLNYLQKERPETVFLPGTARIPESRRADRKQKSRSRGRPGRPDFEASTKVVHRVPPANCGAETTSSRFRPAVRGRD